MIRVIIEREVRSEHFEDYLEMIRQARKQANRKAGFIAGELLQEKDNPQKAIIISSWENVQAWQDWSISEERLEILKQMRPLLKQDEKVTLLENCQLLV